MYVKITEYGLECPFISLPKEVPWSTIHMYVGFYKILYHNYSFLLTFHCSKKNSDVKRKIFTTYQTIVQTKFIAISGCRFFIQ